MSGKTAEGSIWWIAAMLTVGIVFVWMRPQKAAETGGVDPEPPREVSHFTNTTTTNFAATGRSPLETRQEGAALYPVIRESASPASVEELGRWVGAAVCGECHQDNYESAKHTSHYLTSRKASEGNLRTEYEKAGAWMETGDPSVRFNMIQTAEGFFQSLVQDGVERHRAQVELIIGSGKLAQTYLTWYRDDLFQLPITHLTAGNRWMNSPGYTDGFGIFARPILNVCLDCHTTGYTLEPDVVVHNRFKSRHVIPGVTCERCHGSGRLHVDHHRAHPDDRTARHILDPRQLATADANALCSQCHADQSGEKKSKHKSDVHSNNQLERLKKSECFTGSGGMGCTVCHNPHRLERGDNRLFAQRCQTCHKVDDCGAVTASQRTHFSENCATCHMKREAISDITFETPDGEVGLEMVDHFIRVFDAGK